MEYDSALKRKEMLTYATTWMNLEDLILSEISQSQEDHILYDSTYMKYPEQANPSKEKADWWLPGVVGGTT